VERDVAELTLALVGCHDLGEGAAQAGDLLVHGPVGIGPVAKPNGNPDVPATMHSGLKLGQVSKYLPPSLASAAVSAVEPGGPKDFVSSAEFPAIHDFSAPGGVMKQD